MLYDLFNVVELALFFLFIRQIFRTKKVVRYLPFVFIAFVCFGIIDYVFLRQSETFNSKIAGAENILIIILCLYYFYEKLQETNSLLIYSTLNFWVIIALLIYSSGTFFLYLYAESTLKDKEFQDIYITINSSFVLLKNILLSIAMLKKPENLQQSSSLDEGFLTDLNNYPSF